MTPSLEWLHRAEKCIRLVLEDLRPQLLKAQGAIEHNLKDDKTAVTEMDVLVENRLRQALNELDASIPFYGEESGAQYHDTTYWLVDPIDGTEAFIRGIPVCTNMVALIHKGKPIMGIIYNFILDEYYLAIEGQGATCNGHAIHVSDRPHDRAFMLLSANPRKNAVVEGIAERLRMDDIANNVIKLGAGGYEHALVAKGSAEARIAYYSSGKQWDHAPGVLLIQEAGGKVANIGKSDYDLQDLQYIAANPATFDKLMAFMANELS